MKGKLNFLRVALMAMMLLCTALPLFAYSMPVPITTFERQSDGNNNYRVHLAVNDPTMAPNSVRDFYWPLDQSYYTYQYGHEVTQVRSMNGVACWISRYYTNTNDWNNYGRWIQIMHCATYDPLAKAWNWQYYQLTPGTYGNVMQENTYRCEGGIVSWCEQRYTAPLAWTNDWKYAIYDPQAGQWKQGSTPSIGVLNEIRPGKNGIISATATSNSTMKVYYRAYDPQSDKKVWVAPASPWDSGILSNNGLLNNPPTVDSTGTVNWASGTGTPYTSYKAAYNPSTHAWSVGSSVQSQPLALFTNSTPPTTTETSWAGWFVDLSLGTAPTWDFGGGTLTYDTNSLVHFGSGLYTVTQTNGSSTAGPVTIQTDYSAPTSPSVSINSAATYATSTAATLTLSATDTGSGVSQMMISESSTFSGAVWETYSSSKSFTLSSAEGTKYVYAKFKDSVGNVSSSVSDTIILDTSAPTSPSISINGGATYATSTAATLTLSATDTGSGVSQMMISTNADFSSASWVTYSTSQSFTLPAGEGAKYVYAKFKDYVGHISTAVTDSIVLDINPPTVMISAPPEAHAGIPITILANASDSAGTITHLEIAVDGAMLAMSSGNTCNASWTPTVLGSHMISATATDGVGRTSVSNRPIEVINTPPTVTITSPEAGIRVDTGVPLTVTADAFDSDGTITKVEFFSFSTSVGVDTTPPYSATWSPGPSGPRSITAKATDNMGQTTTSSALNILANRLPTVTMTSPAEGAIVDSGVPVTISADASDADGTITKVEFFSFSTRIGVVTTAPYSIQFAFGPLGVRSLTARVTDSAGSTTTSAVRTMTVQ